MDRKMKKRSFVVIGIVVGIIALILGILYIIKIINYHKTYEYKFLKLDYTKEDVKKLDTLSTETKDYILTLEKNKDIISLIDEKYFIEKHFKEYLDYYKESDYDLTDVVAIVNVGANKEFYTDTKKSDISKGELILTNKFYTLDNTYNSDQMINVSNQYSYGENQMVTEQTYNAFLNMFNKAKEEGLTLIINSSFRSFEEQEEIYNDYKSSRGEEYADSIAARPGHSEHQTGMAIDIQTYGSRADTFEEFDEFKWLQENAYKYGFILRYPKDKEYLTGYDYESWHYRYVGVDAATYIHENNITFDEYYAYFVEKD